MPAHILYLLFPNYGAPTIPAQLIINKLIQVVPGCKTIGVEIILMLIRRMRSFVTPTYKVGLALAIIYAAKIFSLTRSLYQKDSGQAGMTNC